MIKKVAVATVFLASCGLAAQAQQEQRVEVSGNVSYALSDGVSGSTTDAFGNTLTRIDPADSVAWDARFGYRVNPNVEFGFLFGMQPTNLEVEIAGRPSPFDIGDETITHYHGYFAYNFGESASVQPYLLLGLGATSFGSVDINGANLPGGSGTRSVDGNTKFSTTWAAGLKLFPGRTVGIRLESRWTPTYIKSDAVGWWCDPYWGCYTVGDAQYANQFNFGGGLILRF
jgi:hypothetical protein